MPIDLRSTAYLELATDSKSPTSYQHVKDGALYKLLAYVGDRARAQIWRYRLTVGNTSYTGAEILALRSQ
jgi:hypothetical protein